MSAKREVHHVARWSEIDAGGVVVILAMVALLYFAALRPMLDHRDAMAAQRELLEAESEKADTAVMALKNARERLAAVQKQITDNPQKLEPARALNNRLALITRAASARVLDLSDIRPGAASTGARYTTVPITLSGTGSFANCVAYLHDLHENFGDTAVTAVKISGSPADEAKPAAFQFDLRWYAAPR